MDVEQITQPEAMLFMLFCHEEHRLTELTGKGRSGRMEAREERGSGVLECALVASWPPPSWPGCQKQREREWAPAWRGFGVGGVGHEVRI